MLPFGFGTITTSEIQGVEPDTFSIISNSSYLLTRADPARFPGGGGIFLKGAKK